MMTDDNHWFSVYYVAYRPEFTEQKTILLAVFLLGESLAHTLLCKKLENCDPVLAADPGADIQLITGILNEIESRALQDREFLDQATEWSTSIEISKSQISSTESPSKLIERLFDSVQSKESSFGEGE